MALPPAGTYIDMSGEGLYDEKQQLLATVASSIRYLEEGCRCCLREGLRNPSPINQSILIQYLEYRNFRILNKRALCSWSHFCVDDVLYYFRACRR